MSRTLPRIGIVGLGYVGLPLALAFGRRQPVVGYDHDPRRVEELRRGQDRKRQAEPDELVAVPFLTLTTDPAALRACTVFILTVPTPVDSAQRPDLRLLLAASATVGRCLKPGDTVIYESTVYPGCTEEDCVPVLERESGLRFNADFTVGYSPERISPGDPARRLPDVVKITAGSTPEAAAFVDDLYRAIIPAGTYRAPSIRVAEAAKVVENAQRDVNISFVNELALLFDRLGLDTHEVLAAAATKWNFLPFQPGLVGGHCISVDPYYLLHKAEEVGYLPQVIASGRRVNAGIPAFIANKLAKRLTRRGFALTASRVLVLGITYKENCPDIRNSRVAELVRELTDWGLRVDVYDPVADSAEVQFTYGITLQSPTGRYQALVKAVNHAEFDLFAWDDWADRDAVLGRLAGAAPPDVASLW
jgi:UDP-N-acetyl-D-galactosamine dehydrogenase